MVKPIGNNGIIGNVAFSKLTKVVSLAVAIATRSKKVKRELPNSNQMAKPL